MPQWNTQLDDEPQVDSSVPLNGVDTTQPPNALPKNLAHYAVNRLAANDDLNRPRPGITALFQTGTGNVDSLFHIGEGVFLCNSAGTWETYDSRGNVLNTRPGGPSFTLGDQIYGALCDQVFYFSRGDVMYKYTPATNTFGTNTLPSPWTTALYPTWALNRLIYANTNTIVVSDILAPESWHPATQELTLDPVASDVITGIALWQNQQLVVFRNGSTWMIQTGPGLDVPYWSLQKASSTVGCCSHGTIQQCGSDVYFLSETGRGVYALSQMPTSDQIGVWQPISAPVKADIDRINWAAVDCARANYWNDLYILSVPLDGATFNNYMLVYSVTLGNWQGIWCFEQGTTDVGFRDSARDRTNPSATLFLVAQPNGVISQFTYPVLRQYFDQDLALVHHTYDSSLVTRSFTFGLFSMTAQYIPQMNQIQPHSVKIQFLESVDDVTVTILVDRYSEVLKTVSQTSGSYLVLPIAAIPFDLDVIGYFYLPLSLMSVGICDEVQVQLDGDGNWTVFQVRLAAYEFAPLEAI